MTHPHPPPVSSTSLRLVANTLAIMAGIALALVAWRLVDLLLLLFASLLVGLMLHDFADLLQRRLRLPFALALFLAVVVPLAVLVGVFGLFGNMMFDQFSVLARQWPVALATVKGWLGGSEFGREAMAQINSYAPKAESVLGVAQATLANVGSALSYLAIVLVAGVYVAAQPRMYRDGLLDMLPAEQRGRARIIIRTVRESLTAWLKGQAIGMLFVAVATAIALAIVGLPSALAIGLVAGLCEFVPYLGVVIVTVPTIILGFGQGVDTGWLTIAALVVVQQVQGNVVMPIAQRRFGDLPPVLTIFSLIAAGVLMGPLGVILAVPLTVVAVALIKAMLHARDRQHAEV